METMDKDEKQKLMTVFRPMQVPYKTWPKYRMVCGEITRLLSHEDAPERLVNNQWHPDQG